ncbi:MAG: hypothetical protein QXL94_01535 [Candidatus Parvarchaeum sp.]
MSSSYEKHKYGSAAPRSNNDWSKANPHDLRLRPIPTEKVCGMCDTQREFVFALTDVVVCSKCANEILERTDTQKSGKIYVGNPMNPMFCARCGAPVTIGMKFNMRMCAKCIERAGKYEMGWRIKKASGARKIA